MQTFRFVRDAGPKDWPALPRRFSMGERIEKFTGPTYGPDLDDNGERAIECTLDGETFFTVPASFLTESAL